MSRDKAARRPLENGRRRSPAARGRPLHKLAAQLKNKIYIPFEFTRADNCRQSCTEILPPRELRRLVI
ncbi:hypothetical protein JS73_01750 [Synergistes jonesii]|uniref:Uncharacterized protein n=1 Tax=Synergistes jonesii TaxID=2754 RepID=A0A073IUI9_9BACT|nr:hypothetical protein EH55_10395 [Synergistes jonesii]OFB63311.1 hypothetical protein JS72_06870 [Synergistes jonesii]OFB64853.1 hypothetical protein JS73_01750 [Synergistes jonesii]OFB66253.1 hypothetical protein JS79_01755 [Synergistes jonesii]OFB69020.1 hypothetical protein JS78_01755 [Synergistes jonesii]